MKTMLTGIAITPGYDFVLICFQDDRLGCTYWRCRAGRAYQLSKEEAEILDKSFPVIVQLPLPWQRKVLSIKKKVIALDEYAAPVILDLAVSIGDRQTIAVSIAWNRQLLLSYAVELRKEEKTSQLLCFTNAKTYFSFQQRMQRAGHWKGLGRYTDAVNELQVALNLSLDSISQAECLIELGSCKYNLGGDIEKLKFVQNYYQEALQLIQVDPPQDTTLDYSIRSKVKQLELKSEMTLAHLALRSGDIEDAESRYNKLLKSALLPNNPELCRETLEGKAALQMVLQAWQEAARLYNSCQIIEVEPSKAGYTNKVNLARCYVELHHYMEAEIDLQWVVQDCECNSLRADALFELGRCYEGLEQFDKALQAYQESLMAERKPESLTALARLMFLEQANVSQGLAQEALTLLNFLVGRSFSPIWDYSREWQTLYFLLGERVLGGAGYWIGRMVGIFPIGSAYWSPERKTLLQLIQEDIQDLA